MLPGIRDFRADILNTSTVKYLFPAIIKTVCLVNVRYFPFDTQICEIKLGSWSHHGLDLDIISGASGTPTILSVKPNGIYHYYQLDLSISVLKRLSLQL